MLFKKISKTKTQLNTAIHLSQNNSLLTLVFLKSKASTVDKSSMTGKANILKLIFISLNFVACTKAVPVVELFSKPQGLTLSVESFEVNETSQFVLSGTCIPEITGIEISFDQGSNWSDIQNNSNVSETSLLCQDAGTFQLKSLQTLAQLKTAQSSTESAKVYLRGLWVKGTTEEVIATITATQSNTPPTISLSTSQARVVEGSSAQLTLSLSTPATETITVDVATSDSSASGSTHYTAVNQTVTFHAGENSKVINISTADINPAPGISVCDPDLEFKISASNPTNAALDTTTEQIFIIEDNDVPTLSVTATSTVSEGAASLNILVELDRKCISKDITITTAANSGTATLGTDFSFTNSSQVIVANSASLSKSFVVTIIDDTTYEGNESFEFRIVSSNAIFNTGTTTKTILITDNDTMPTLGFETTSSTTNEGSLTSTKIKLSHASSSPVTFQLTRDPSSTALSGSDYDITSSGNSIPLETNLTIPAGSTEYPVSFAAIDDATYEPSEFLQLTIATPSGATIGTFYHHTFNIEMSDNTIPTVSNKIYYVQAGSSITIYADEDTSIGMPFVGNDPDSGQTLTFTGASLAPQKGTVSPPTGSQITYNSNSASYGTETLQVQVTDGHVNSSIASIQIKIMHHYTWIGAVNSNWSNADNWCGTVNSTHNACTQSMNVPPSFSDAAFIDETCSSNCNVIIDAASSAQSLTLAKYSIYLNFNVSLAKLILAGESALSTTVNSSGSTNYVEVSDELLITKYGAKGNGLIKLIGYPTIINGNSVVEPHIPSLEIMNSADFNTNVIQNGNFLKIGPSAGASYLNDTIEYKILVTGSTTFYNMASSFYFNRLKLLKTNTALIPILITGNQGFNTSIAYICDGLSSPIQFSRGTPFTNIHQGSVTHKNAGCSSVNEYSTRLSGSFNQTLTADNTFLGNLEINKSTGNVQMLTDLDFMSSNFWINSATNFDINGKILKLNSDMGKLELNYSPTITRSGGQLWIDGSLYLGNDYFSVPINP